VVSHHGEYEFGSPKRPKTLEAFALHYADDLDAKMNHVSGLLEADKESSSRWTPFQRVYGRYLFKGTAADKQDRETQDVDSREDSGPRNLSLLDLLGSSTKGEDF
jgi:3'-5' exoribonuclease